MNQLFIYSLSIVIFCWQNYGDESDAYGLINPSIYSNRGVYEKDFFKPRDQYEVNIKTYLYNNNLKITAWFLSLSKITR